MPPSSGEAQLGLWGRAPPPLARMPPLVPRRVEGVGDEDLRSGRHADGGAGVGSRTGHRATSCSSPPVLRASNKVLKMVKISIPTWMLEPGMFTDLVLVFEERHVAGSVGVLVKWTTPSSLPVPPPLVPMPPPSPGNITNMWYMDFAGIAQIGRAHV